MVRKIVYGLVAVMVLISWPVSLMLNKPDVIAETIFYQEEMETLVFNQKLALSYSPIKRIFYNKYSVYQQRYVKNFLNIADINNYFFSSHPREDVAGISYRFKFPYGSLAIMGVALVSLIKSSDKRLKWAGWWFGLGWLCLPLLKNTDGWDFYLYWPLAYLVITGCKKLAGWKYGLAAGLIVLVITATEVWRII